MQRTTDISRSVDEHVLSDSDVQSAMEGLEAAAMQELGKPIKGWKVIPRGNIPGTQITDHWALTKKDEDEKTHYGGMIQNSGSSLNVRKGTPSVEVKKGPLGKIDADELTFMRIYLEGRIKALYD